LGDDINTDDIVPSHILTSRSANEIAKNVLKFIDPKFHESIKNGGIIVAGENFGTGSSREEAVHVFKILGVRAIIAKSFARIYFRNLINNAIPAITLDWKAKEFEKGDKLVIEIEKGIIHNITKNMDFSFKILPSFLINILKEGGILNKLSKELVK
jgi:3-isopropylmalate/(R)-2-methylmalate dehydratase small subunit